MKIIKHSKEVSGHAAGLLLGLDLDGTLEVSNSFALPVSSEGDDKVRTSGQSIVSITRLMSLPRGTIQAVDMRQRCCGCLRRLNTMTALSDSINRHRWAPFCDSP